MAVTSFRFWEAFGLFFAALMGAGVILLPGSWGGCAQASEVNVEINRQAAAQGGPLTALVSPDVLEDYHAYIGRTDPVMLQHFDRPGARRDVVELVLLQQALQRGGISHPVAFVPSPSYKRILADLAHGRARLAANSIWRSDLLDHPYMLLISEPVFKRGEIEAGLYTSPRNDQALRSRTLDDFAQLSAVTSRVWRSDWNSLESLPLKRLVHARQWPMMLQLVASMRVDFLLAPFQPGPAMRLEDEGVSLVPIPEVKIILGGSRHFALSRSHPGSRALLSALNQGLHALEQDNTLAHALHAAGMQTGRTRAWRVLNALPMETPRSDPTKENESMSR